MKHTFLLSVLCFTLHTIASAQKQPFIDSLLTELAKAKEDTAKVKILSKISAEVYQANPDEGLRYGKEALTLAEKLQWKNGIASAKLSIGRIYWQVGNFKEALNNHFQSLELWKETGNKDRIAVTYAYIGQDYADSGDYSQALKYMSLALVGYEALGNKGLQVYVHSIMAWIYGNMGMYPENAKHQYAMLKIAEETGDKYSAAIAYSNLATVFETQGNFEKAIETYTQCLKIGIEFDDHANVANSYNKIGSCYKNMGNYAEALKNHRSALEIGKKIKNRNSIGEAYANMGDVYVVQGNDAEALQYFRLAAKEFRAVDNKQSLATQLMNIGACLTHLEDYSEAQRYFDNANSIVKTMESIAVSNHYYKGRVKLDSATGNWKNAFEHYNLFVSTRDSMHNQENTRKIVQTRMLYEFDKKEATAKLEQEKKDLLAKEELERQKLIRNGFMGGFAVVLLFAGVFFSQRNKIKAGKKRSDELLLNILPEEVAEELKAKGSSEAQLLDQVTVLFTDFKGFTAISEQLSPRELVHDLHQCFSAFDHICEKYGIEKIKTIGDAYMAAGGLPTPNETHVRDVVNAALEIAAVIETGKAKKISRELPYFEIRIGIHTGPVVAGIVGVKKFQYDIWGDTVNTANRMESNGEVGRVNISQATYDLLKNDPGFEFESRGKIEAKGKGEMEMWFVAPIH